MTTTTAIRGREVRLPVAVEDGEPALRRIGFKLGDHDRYDPLFRFADLPTGWRPTGLHRSKPLFLLDGHRRRRAVIRYSGYPHLEAASLRLVSLREYTVRCVAKGAPVIADPQWATPTALLAIAREELARADAWIEHFQRSNLGAEAARQSAKRDLWIAFTEHFNVKAAA